MSFDTLLSVLGFAISLGGLVPVLFLRTRRKLTVLTVTLGALAVSTGIAFFDHQRSERLISSIQNDISEQLAVEQPQTFDQIYIKLNYRPYPAVSEALFRSVEEGRIKQRQIDLYMDGKPIPAKAYYLPD